MGQALPAVRALLKEDASCKALLEEAESYHARPSAQPLLQTGRTAPRGGVERLLLIGGEVPMCDGDQSLIVLHCQIFLHRAAKEGLTSSHSIPG